MLHDNFLPIGLERNATEIVIVFPHEYHLVAAHLPLAEGIQLHELGLLIC